MAFAQKLLSGFEDLLRRLGALETRVTNVENQIKLKADKTHTHTAAQVSGVLDFPNWNSYGSRALNKTYTAANDGWLFYMVGPLGNDHYARADLTITPAGSSTAHTVTIGKDSIYKYNYGNDCQIAAMYPIKKGDKYIVRVYNTNDGSNQSTNEYFSRLAYTLRWYNCR